MYIALDAMGGDNAPLNNIKGAILFLKSCNRQDVGIYLVGPQDILEKELEKLGATDLPIEIVHAEDVVSMDEPPSNVIR